MDKPKETPKDLARCLYKNMPRSIHPLEVDGEPYWPSVEHLPEYQFCERLAERLHEAENADSYGMAVYMALGEWDEVSNALADVLCWMAGFSAAGGEPPPGIERLRELNITIKRRARAHRDKPHVIPMRPF